MHHVASWSCFGQVLKGSYFFLGLHSDKLSHWYNTQDNKSKNMDCIEQENRELREEVTTLRDGYKRLTAMMEALSATQN